MSVNLNGIKTQLKTILDAANTTTASTDLSGSMVNRVSQVLKVNPERLPIQASFYPCVTIFIDQKDIDSATIGYTQLAGKRKGTVSVKIIGAVWNTNFSSVNEDPADEDCEHLMENIEEILRSNHNINSLVTWQVPSGVTYHSGSFDEESNLRAGILTVNGTVFY